MIVAHLKSLYIKALDFWLLLVSWLIKNMLVFIFIAVIIAYIISEVYKHIKLKKLVDKSILQLVRQEFFELCVHQKIDSRELLAYPNTFMLSEINFNKTSYKIFKIHILQKLIDEKILIKIPRGYQQPQFYKFTDDGLSILSQQRDLIKVRVSAIKQDTKNYYEQLFLKANDGDKYKIELYKIYAFSLFGILALLYSNVKGIFQFADKIILMYPVIGLFMVGFCFHFNAKLAILKQSFYLNILNGTVKDERLVNVYNNTRRILSIFETSTVVLLIVVLLQFAFGGIYPIDTVGSSMLIWIIIGIAAVFENFRKGFSNEYYENYILQSQISRIETDEQIG